MGAKYLTVYITRLLVEAWEIRQVHYFSVWHGRNQLSLLDEPLFLDVCIVWGTKQRECFSLGHYHHIEEEVQTLELWMRVFCDGAVWIAVMKAFHLVGVLQHKAWVIALSPWRIDYCMIWTLYCIAIPWEEKTELHGRLSGYCYLSNYFEQGSVNYSFYLGLCIKHWYYIAWIYFYCISWLPLKEIDLHCTIKL